MGLSRTARISLLLVIDVVFFFVEITIGPIAQYLTKNLTHRHFSLSCRLCDRFTGTGCGQLSHAEVSFLSLLIKDSVIILLVTSDVLSLIIALYAIKVCSRRPVLCLLLDGVFS
jgi:hypothetical protein